MIHGPYNTKLLRIYYQFSYLQWTQEGLLVWSHLLKNCLLEHVFEGKIEWRIGVTGRWGRRGGQLMGELKRKRGYWKLKQDAPDRTTWGNNSARGCGPVIGYTTEWMNEWINGCMNVTPKKFFHRQVFLQIFWAHLSSSLPYRASWFGRLLFFKCPKGFRKERFKKTAGMTGWIYFSVFFKDDVSCWVYVAFVTLKNDHGALVEWYWQGNTEVLGKNLPLYHFIHHRTSADCKKIESGSPRWQATER